MVTYKSGVFSLARLSEQGYLDGNGEFEWSLAGCCCCCCCCCPPLSCDQRDDGCCDINL